MDNKSMRNDNKIGATQEINPITGKKYGYNEFVRNVLGVCGVSELSKTNSFIEYQFALAAMEVADGKISMTNYNSDRSKAKVLVSKLNNSEIPLNSINNALGFDLALNNIGDKDVSLLENSLKKNKTTEWKYVSFFDDMLVVETGHYERLNEVGETEYKFDTFRNN